jgi:hypothetical protein
MPAKKNSRPTDVSSSSSVVDLQALNAAAPAPVVLAGEVTGAPATAYTGGASSLLEGDEGAAAAGGGGEDSVEFDDEAVLNASGSTYGGRWSRDEDLALRRGVEILGVSSTKR